MHVFYNKTLLFDVFSCLVACRVIKKEKREIDIFIQLNLKNSKERDRFKSKGYKSHLIKNWIYQIRLYHQISREK